MRLTSIQKDRAGGVLLGQAIGDALGVPYEFGAPISVGEAAMIGGGLGPYAPGEWSDDAQMAICIAQASADGADLRTDAGLNEVAAAFLRWQTRGASDIGIQTSRVLDAARKTSGPLADVMTTAARAAAREGRAGNGALMRTSVVGLVDLGHPEATADVAARVSALTHADQRCIDSCVLWSEAVRIAVVEGRFDIRAGLSLIPEPRRTQWRELIDQAETRPPSAFDRNGFTVTAFQAAWSAIYTTRHIEGPDQVEAALQTVIAIGHDTDTIAAIAGGLLGARYGVSGLPSDLARRVNGWPGLRGRDLVGLALAMATGSQEAQYSGVSTLSGYSPSRGVPHPDDCEVILGTESDLSRCGDLKVTAVVSLSRIGKPELAAAGVGSGKHAEVWLIDSENPAKNAHLSWTLTDAARTIAALRDQGERVLVHCVRAEHRTPAVALAYSRLRKAGPGAEARIEEAIGHPVDGLLWRTACQLNA